MMKRTNVLTTFALTSLSLLTACTDAPPSKHDRRAAMEAAAFDFEGDGGASSARVRVTRAADGRVFLHGETRVSPVTGAHRCVVEDVTLASDGRLSRADIAIGATCDGQRDLRMVLDPTAGEARVWRGQGESAARVPSDAPWVYSPPDGIVTPIAAWVVAQSAKGSASVRLVDAAHDGVPLVARDQVAIETERGTTVIVGNDGAEVDGVFVERLRMIDLGVTLVRAPKARGRS